MTAIVGRLREPRTRQIAISSAVAVAIVLAGITAMGANPFAAIGSLVEGAIGSPYTIGQTLVIGAVLTMTALAAALPFTARMFNVGAEGQMFAGASAALLAGVTFGDLPFGVVAALVAGAVGGAAWALVPGAIRAFLGGSEMIVSLLMNFVGTFVADYIIRNVYPDTSGQSTIPVGDEARLPTVWLQGGVHLGVLIALACAAGAWLLLSRTRSGFAMRAIGMNPTTARLAGFSERGMTLLVFALGGAAAGLGGAFLVLGGSGQLSLGLSPGYGFIGVVVALIAGLRPAWTPLVAVVAAGLLVGSNRLQIDVGLPSSMGIVVLSTIVLALLAARVIVLKRN